LNVLHPDDTDRFPQADDGALVLCADIHGTRILLLSDLGKPGQNALMKRNADVHAEIVVSGLPAQGEPLADALLDAIQPRVIIVTDSEYPATARAGHALRERLARRHIPVLYTSESGAVTIEVRARTWRLRGMRQREIRSTD
ncbi:MAG TPA: hypothetical protein VGK40_07305, partial [Verrucomicrobiae bacterium]